MEEIFKKYGWPGLVGFVLGGVISSVATLYVSHHLQQSGKPAALVVQVEGAAEQLTLKLDHRHTDSPESRNFFRVEQVQPGLHLVELFSDQAPVHSNRLVIEGGADNSYRVELPEVELPEVASAEGNPGWIYLGTTVDGKFVNAALTNKLIPRAGDTVSVKEPAFVRTMPSATATSATVTAGEAFGWLSAGPEVQVEQVEKIGDQYWALISAEQSSEESGKL